MPVDAKTIQLPESYTTPADSELRIINHPESPPSVNPIIILTLNRPEKYNAMTVGMIESLERTLQLVDLDKRVKCVVLTGAGKAFCSGIDLNPDATAGKKMPVAEFRDIGGRLALAMYNCSKTIIAAYNGLAVGIGMTSTLAAGIRITSAKSAFGFPFSRIGLTMESASSFFLPRMVGYSNAIYLLTMGKTYPANSKVLDEQVNPMADYLNRQLIWKNASTAEEAHLIDSPILFDMFGGRDHLEAKRALFKEKPRFVDDLESNALRTYPWWRELNINSKPKAALGDPKL
ncbi:hypothetical protein AJ79_10170 [Helicocarpus griseus UAMH5409]|uniref:Enoyl-CoA hydratase n=1 Tax=Helicocarpus griseus UAMH5409 TaxID=1447875 RepID=A0A2B7WEX9_9EURO|nr:hypothetical protein AJ79_10170 [Helicocarpus griseus UAMH5409]